jgi:hypothetical protein
MHGMAATPTCKLVLQVTNSVTFMMQAGAQAFGAEDATAATDAAAEEGG